MVEEVLFSEEQGEMLSTAYYNCNCTKSNYKKYLSNIILVYFFSTCSVSLKHHSHKGE